MISQDTVDRINKLIFNCLAKGDSVFIEGIGSLSTKTITVISSKTKKPTAKKIVTLFKDRCAVDLKDLMLSLEELSQSNVEEIYRDWLSVSSIKSDHENRLDYNIDSVVTIKLDKERDIVTITPSKRLESYLNPLGETQTQQNAPKKSSMVKFFILSLLMGVIIVIVLIFMNIIPLDLFNTNQPTVVQGQPTKKEVVSPDVKLNEQIIEETVTVSVTVPTPDKKEQSQELTPVKGKYYLIVGSFSLTENAIELVMTLKSKGYNAYAIPSKNGKKTMVSIADFATEEQAKEKMNHNDFNYDCWVYYFE